MQIAALSGWTREQKHVVAASFLGWSLDAFDFFLLVFVLKDIAQEFDTDISNVTLAILLTLAMRPIGAFIFGMVQQGIVYAGWNPDWFKFFMGVMLLFAVIANNAFRNYAAKR